MYLEMNLTFFLYNIVYQFEYNLLFVKFLLKLLILTKAFLNKQYIYND